MIDPWASGGLFSGADVVAVGADGEQRAVSDLQVCRFDTARSVATFAGAVIVVLLLARYFQITLALLFVAYLLYGMVRPWVSKRWRREIESDETDEEPEER